MRLIFKIILLSLLCQAVWAKPPRHDGHHDVHHGYKDEQSIIDERAAIQRAATAWAQALNDNDPEGAAALYENQILVYATFKRQISNYDDLVQYFTNLANKEKFKVNFTEQNIRVYGPTAINSGMYHFSYSENGKLQEIPARFTFVYTLTPYGWRIVDHHSSVLPE